VKAGATQLQGTINGYGERCGNANLCSVIPTLKLKLGIDVVSDQQMSRLTEGARYISEVANLVPDPFLPYIGSSAFSHKAGLHVSGLSKWAESYQHVNPETVGNQPKTLVSELSGRVNIAKRAKELGVELPLKGEEVNALLDKVKQLESRGFQYENAEASFDMLVHRARADYKSPFELVDYMVLIEKRRRTPTRKDSAEELLAEAMVKVSVDGEVRHTVSEGNGPVNALDRALRKALKKFYPDISKVKLIDYKVRIIGQTISTGSVIRVLIESSDGVNTWRTMGSSDNIIEASWLALADSLEYWLLRNIK
jgi:2-isopropylmalate synthase